MQARVDRRRDRRAGRIERPRQSVEEAGRLQFLLGFHDRSRVLPYRGGEPQDEVRRVRARLGEVLHQCRIAGGRVTPVRSRGSSAESRRRVEKRPERECAENDDTDSEGVRWASDDTLGDLAPPTLVRLARDDLRGPEHGAPEYREQCGQQRDPSDEHHGDPDRERDAEVVVDPEAREQQGQQRQDDGPGRCGDRLTDSCDRTGHGVVRRQAGSEAFPDAEHEE